MYRVVVMKRAPRAEGWAAKKPRLAAAKWLGRGGAPAVDRTTLTEPNVDKPRLVRCLQRGWEVLERMAKWLRQSPIFLTT